MRFLLYSVVFFAIGCDQSKVKDKKEQSVFHLKLAPSSLAMFFRDGNVKLGESVHSTFQKVPRSKSATSLHTLPAVLSAPFKAYGWEKENDAYAFITHNDAIYLVLQSHEDVSKGYVDQVLEQYEKTFLTPNKKIEFGKSSYWFWENDGQRLMICKTENREQKWSITISLGEKHLMKKLRMDPISAQSDLKK